jgi:hypothetical protein
MDSFYNELMKSTVDIKSKVDALFAYLPKESENNPTTEIKTTEEKKKKQMKKKYQKPHEDE